MLVLIYFLIGLVVGSFADATIWRLHRILNPPKTKPKDADRYSFLKGRSMCEHCHTTLQPRDLIPLLSWLSTGGKCRYCKHPIGPQPLLLELGSAAAFAGLAFFWPTDLETTQQVVELVVWSVFLVGLIIIAVYDLRWLIIPDKVILPMIVGAGLLALSDAIIFDEGAEPIKDAVLGLLIGGGFFYGLFMVSGGKWLGGGDVKLGFFLGLALGPALSFVALVLAFNGSLLILLPLMAMKIVKRKQRVPFGPFLILAMYLSVIFGQSLIDWYNDTFLYGLL